MSNLFIQESKSMRRDIIDHIKKYKGMLEYPRFYYTGVTHVQKDFIYIYIYIVILKLFNGCISENKENRVRPT